MPIAASSNELLIKFLCNSDEIVVHTLIELLRSRLSLASGKLHKQFSSLDKIPVRNTTERREMVTELVNLLGWYGSNTIAYRARVILHGDGVKQYSTIAMDVVKFFRRRLPRKQRLDLPRAPGVTELEEMIVQMFIGAAFHNKSVEEITQNLIEAGLEGDAAKNAAKIFGPGTSIIALPVLVKLLGKKTVTVIIGQIIVSVTQKFIGKGAAQAVATRLLIKYSQKTISKLVSVIGWILLAFEVVLFMTSPARRVTIKVVPYIALIRVRNQLKA